MLSDFLSLIYQICTKREGRIIVGLPSILGQFQDNINF